METITIATDIATLQADVASRQMTTQQICEALNTIKKKTMEMIKPPQSPEEEIVQGYRADAIEQGRLLARMITDQDLHTAPDMTLFHLSACAEQFSGKVHHYFKLRNHRAGEALRAEGGVTHG